jgi:hypothetical protein
MTFSGMTQAVATGGQTLMMALRDLTFRVQPYEAFWKVRSFVTFRSTRTKDAVNHGFPVAK